MADLKLLAGTLSGGPLQLLEEEPPRLQFLVAGTDGLGPRLAGARQAGFQAAFLFAGRRWLVLDGGSADVRVNGCPVTALRILDHGDVVEVAGWRLQLEEEVEETVAADSPLMRGRKACAYCQIDFQIGEAVVYCPMDKVAQHADCWIKNRGRCAGPRCPYLSKPRAAAWRTSAA